MLHPQLIDIVGQMLIAAADPAVESVQATVGRVLVDIRPVVAADPAVERIVEARADRVLVAIRPVVAADPAVKKVAINPVVIHLDLEATIQNIAVGMRILITRAVEILTTLSTIVRIAMIIVDLTIRITEEMTPATMMLIRADAVEATVEVKATVTQAVVVATVAKAVNKVVEAATAKLPANADTSGEIEITI
jgi:hypothetical protein